MKKLKNYLPMIINILAILIPYFLGLYFVFKGLGDSFSGPIRFSISGLVAFIYLIISLGLHIILHEFGHLVTGLHSGYKFLFFRIWKYCLVKKDGKFSIKHFHIPGSLGQCLMAPPEKKNGDFPFLLYNLGGIIINGLLSLVALGFFIALKLSLGSSFFYFFFFVGAYLAITNAYPFEGLPNDGSNIKSLLKNEDSKLAFYNALKMSELTVTKIPTREEMKALVDEKLYSNFSDPLVQAITSENIGLYVEDGKYIEALKFSDFLLGQKNMNIMVRNMIRMDRASLFLLLGYEDEAKKLFSRKDFLSFIKGNQAENHRLYYMYYSLLEKDENKASQALAAFEKAASRSLMESDNKFDRLLIDLTEKRRQDWENVEISRDYSEDFSKKILFLNRDKKLFHIKYRLEENFQDSDYLRAFLFLKNAAKDGLDRDLSYLYPGYIFYKDKLVGEISRKDNVMEIKVQLQGPLDLKSLYYPLGSLGVINNKRAKAYLSYFLVGNILQGQFIDRDDFRESIYKLGEEVFFKLDSEGFERIIFGKFLGYEEDFSLRVDYFGQIFTLNKETKLLSDYKINKFI